MTLGQHLERAAVVIRKAPSLVRLQYRFRSTLLAVQGEPMVCEHPLLRLLLQEHLAGGVQQCPMAQDRVYPLVLLPDVLHTFQMRVPDPIAEVILQNLWLALFGSLCASSTMQKACLHQILNSQERDLSLIHI